MRDGHRRGPPARTDQNAREIVRTALKAGQKPMDAIVGATSLSAQSMNLGDTIGTLAPNFEADIVAVPGDPTAGKHHGAKKVAFVMKRRNRR